MLFKIDENLPVEAAELLCAAGHDALTLHDQKMDGQPDPQVADVCRSEQRVLVTLDLDFADIRNYPPVNYHGIVVLRPSSQAKPLVLELVSRLISLLAREELRGCLWIIQPHSLRIREGG